MREDGINKIEAHVAGICMKPAKHGYDVLIARRSPARNLYPGMWECGGGQMNAGEGFEEAVKRQLLEEMGIRVKVICPVSTYEIDVKNKQKIPGIRFLCKFSGYKGKGIKLDKKELSQCKWVSTKELKKYNFIPGVRESVEDVANIVSSGMMK